jgi:putative ABC transport system permease protein
VKALDLKMWRDLWQMKSQMAAIALVLTCGLATYIMFLSTLDALRATQDSYYRDYHFAELFASLKRAPESLRERIQQIDGVAQVETRVVSPVRLDMPGFPEPVMGLMVSVSDRCTCAPGGCRRKRARTRCWSAPRLPRPTACSRATVSASCSTDAARR